MPSAGADRVRVVGVDLGGTKVHAALVDAAGRVCAERREPTARGDADDVLGQLTRLVEVVAADASPSDVPVTAVGVGVPAAVDPQTGVAALAQNVPGLVGTPVAAALSHRLDRSVVADNDAAVAALGERWRGAAAGVDDVVLLSLGTGVGAGIVSGGRLLRGHRGAAGEVADLPLVGDVADPSARRAGVFESAVATARLRRDAQRCGYPDVPALFAAADDGGAVAVLRRWAADVALGVLALVAVVDPAVVVLAGGIGAQPRTRDLLAEALAGLTSRPPNLVTATLGTRAGVLGAARLALDTTGHADAPRL